jgi:hypothetical protein
MRSRCGTLCRAKRVDQAHYRPPNYETPPTHFTSEFTPNESYHLAGIREEIDAAKWKLKATEMASAGIGIGVARFAISNQDLLRLWLVMRRMSLVFFVFGIAGSSASGQAPSTTDDVRKGRHLALMLCTDCHLVAPDQPYAPRLNPPAPSFQSIAQRAGITVDSLRSFLTTTRQGLDNPKGMPDGLSRFQIKQISEFDEQPRASSPLAECLRKTERAVRVFQESPTVPFKLIHRRATPIAR